jgi:RNA polymerase sigma-70 factor, ECF subfamily
MAPLGREDALDVLSRLVRERRVAFAGLARREGLGPEDALEALHDACCTVLAMALRGETPATVEDQAKLLAGVVVNTARNRRRRHYLRRRHDAIEDLNPAAEGPSVETLLAHAEECVRLRTCMNRLCDKQRTVVMMRLLQERPGEDVASALGLKRAHVDVLLHRAKASLVVCMRDSDSLEE